MPAALVRRGHFAFSSGLHGDTWLDLDALVADASGLRDLATRLADKLGRYAARVVCGPLTGGAFVAQQVAGKLGVSFSYSDPAAGYAISPDVAGRRVVIVDDAINAGTAVIATHAALQRAGASVVAVGSVIVCQPAGGRVGAALGVPQQHLLGIETGLWLPAECPLCRSRLPFTTTTETRAD